MSSTSDILFINPALQQYFGGGHLPDLGLHHEMVGLKHLFVVVVSGVMTDIIVSYISRLHPECSNKISLNSAL